VILRELIFRWCTELNWIAFLESTSQVPLEEKEILAQYPLEEAKIQVENHQEPVRGAGLLVYNILRIF